MNIVNPLIYVGIQKKIVDIQTVLSVSLNASGGQAIQIKPLVGNKK